MGCNALYLTHNGIRAVVAQGMDYGSNPQKCRSAPTVNILVKNEEANCAKSSNFDCFCSQNFQTVPLNSFSSLSGLCLWTPLGDFCFQPLVTPSPNENSWQENASNAALLTGYSSGASDLLGDQAHKMQCWVVSMIHMYHDTKSIKYQVSR